MAHLKYFGLKNFRVFDEEGYLFKFAPITLITGANNSGKSSIIKSIKLLDNSRDLYPHLNRLDLTNQDHKLGTLSNLIQNIESPLIFTISFPFLYQEDLVAEITYSKDDESNTRRDFHPLMTKFELFDLKRNKKVLGVKIATFENPPYIEPEYDFHGDEPYNINQFANLDRIAAKYNVFINYDLINEYSAEIAAKWLSHKKINTEFKNKPNIGKNGRAENQTLRNQAISSLYNKNIKYKFELEKLSNNHYSSGKNNILKRINQVLELNQSGTFTGDGTISEEDFWTGLNINMDSPYNLFTYSLPNKVPKAIRDLLAFFLKNKLRDLPYFEYGNISHIPPLRGTSTRLYSVENNSEFNTMVGEFTAWSCHIADSTSMNFINTQLELFEIGTNYKLAVKSLPEYGYNEIKLVSKTNKESRFLVDFGFGTLQVVSILMKIALEIEKNQNQQQHQSPHIIIIDEPEANLHPKWQSKLADVFVNAAYHNQVQLIIETHSEYLIRRFQYLVAKEKLPNEGVKLYYVNDKKTATQNKVEEIQIEPNGNIDFSKFGEGFFDVSLDLITSLWDAQIAQTISTEEKEILHKLIKAYDEIKVLENTLKTKQESETLKAINALDNKITTQHKSINDLLKDIEEKVIKLHQLLNDYNKLIKTLKTRNESEDKRYQKLYAFIDEQWNHHATKIEDYANYIDHWLTEWKKLDERSLSFLLNAELLTRSLTNHNTEDFSPAILQYCRILERELSIQIFNPFKNFLIKKYWQGKSLNNYDILFTDNASPQPANLDELKRLKSLAKNLKADISKTPEIALETSKAFMLGQSIDGLYLLEEASISMEPLILELKQFINDNLNWNNVTNFAITPDLTQSMFSGVLDTSFIDCIEELRKNYRNKASHTAILDLEAMNNTKKLVELLLQFWTKELLS
jgi:AAA15 family ATPase/GTPase